jgi:hypothetical protein
VDRHPIALLDLDKDVEGGRRLALEVPTSCTPRSAMVRAAAASSSVPISSMTMTWGMWFSTASIITACCFVGVWTCILRERPIPG